ncbi:MAG: Gfo/Idh/MocA family oxidoreductase [Bacteroidales bacterium]|nr:Gfo/Idh/MocA family oxidoreductase [Bacteroidales bacterium]
MRKYRWGIIAPGRMATNFTKALQTLENAELYAVASRSYEKAKNFASDFGFKKAYGSYEELAKDPNVDIIYITSPNKFHKEHTLMCLRNDKAVLCEKTFAANYSEVKEMVDMSESRKVFLMEALWSLYQPFYKKSKEFLQSGVLGEIIQLNGYFSYFPDPKRWHLKCDRSLNACSLHDIGIYPVIDALTFIGVPDEILASAQFTHTGSEKSFNALFNYKNGKFATIYSSYCTNAGIGCLLMCEKGNMWVTRDRVMNQQVVVEVFGEEKQVFDYNPPVMGYHWEAQEVMRCLDNGLIESPIVPHSFSIDVIKVLDEIRRKAGIVFLYEKE